MKQPNKKIILASKSPRRREILENLGFNFSIEVSNSEEIFNKNIPVEDALKNVALQKAYEIKKNHLNDDVMIISADTIVYINNEILGKPTDKQDAIRMLKLLENNHHFVYTAIAIITNECMMCDVEKTTVYFKHMSEEDILEYINLENVYDKAGSYAIQGPAKKYIYKIDGNYENVVGLPINLLERMLKNYEKR